MHVLFKSFLCTPLEENSLQMIILSSENGAEREERQLWTLPTVIVLVVSHFA